MSGERPHNVKLSVAARWTTAIEPIFDWPARLAVVACVPPAPIPQAATNAPYPASPLSAAASGQESRPALGYRRNASVNSTLNALHAGVLFPPIPASHVLGDRFRYGLPSKPVWLRDAAASSKNTRPSGKDTIVETE